MNKCYDMMVIGGGPVGGYIAKTVAQEGFNVALVEEHTQPGLPLHCAGLVTSRVFDFLENDAHKDAIQNTITGACIHAPSGSTLSIGDNNIRAFVINRQRFDENMMAQAEKAGAHILFETKFTTAHRTTDAMTIHALHDNKSKMFTCNLLIGADGARSTVRSVFRFPQPRETLQGMGAELTDTHLEPHIVHIFVGNTIAPGFFAWIIPTNTKGTTARVGVCTSARSPKYIKQYFFSLFTHKEIEPYLRDSCITTYMAGSIPLGTLKKTVDSRVMLVGDAAAQVKPTSGGGLYPGLYCARYCSSVALDALIDKKFTLKNLKKYHASWALDIGKELQRGLRFRRIFTRLNDSQLNMYIEKFNNPKILDVINTYGDIDYPSKLLMPLLKTQPSLLRLFPFLSKNI